VWNRFQLDGAGSHVAHVRASSASETLINFPRLAHFWSRRDETKRAFDASRENDGALEKMSCALRLLFALQNKAFDD